MSTGGYMTERTEQGASSIASNEPWSVMGIVHGRHIDLDDEGRPLLEGRATHELRDGVPMDMRVCRYADDRGGRRMNVSALGQVTNHLDYILDRFASCQVALGVDEMTWPLVHAVNHHVLLGPTRYHLAGHTVCPGQVAAAHKVAVGYLAPLRAMLEDADGYPPLSVDAMLERVFERKLLHGAREVCAAPLDLIRRVTEHMLTARKTANVEQATREEVTVALLLTQQTLLGIAWRRFDRLAERTLVRDICERAVRAQTEYVKRQWEERMGELEAPTASECESLCPADDILSPYGADGFPVRSVANAQGFIRRYFDGGLAAHPSSMAYQALFGCPSASLHLVDDARRPAVAARFAAYVGAFTSFVRAQDRMEIQLRRLMGCPEAAAFWPHVSALPTPRTLKWFEMLVGHRLQYPTDRTSMPFLKSQFGDVALPDMVSWNVNEARLAA